MNKYLKRSLIAIGLVVALLCAPYCLGICIGVYEIYFTKEGKEWRAQNYGHSLESGNEER